MTAHRDAQIDAGGTALARAYPRWSWTQARWKRLAAIVFAAADRLGPCPDGGWCHHDCGDGACWRVATCGPLSSVFASDEWPREVVEAEAAKEQHGHL